MKVAIERTDVRATVGGIGAAKAAANYAASLRASSGAVARGQTVALWLDAVEHRFIQELSGMNFFAVIEGELHTPELDGAILPGVTRDSLLTLAHSLGLKTHERRMTIEEVLTGIRTERCSEVFACGTAAIVAPIAEVADVDGAHYKPARIDEVARRLREALLAIQERRAPDPFGWTKEISLE
jgi:branched-chain amino acid aminotransferase